MCFGGCIPGIRFGTRTEPRSSGARYVYDTLGIVTAEARSGKNTFGIGQVANVKTVYEFSLPTSISIKLW